MARALRTGVVQTHVCRPPGVQPPATVWGCPVCHLEYQYGPVIVHELNDRVINLWVRIRRPYWTPYGNPKAAKQEQEAQ